VGEPKGYPINLNTITQQTRFLPKNELTLYPANQQIQTQTDEAQENDEREDSGRI
jgi:hypothetical protein